eukprot:TRINITY_DN3916_c0_g8_i1.p1 TRINITY_DN3916_c0_g8~~TRINITY_DN3916_c0_g8_i1.p1  ORF type:complete len:114 (-),score=5.56 TRINITY_DN3916_c0_g8_i1:227-568(-)
MRNWSTFRIYCGRFSEIRSGVVTFNFLCISSSIKYYNKMHQDHQNEGAETTAEPIDWQKGVELYSSEEEFKEMLEFFDSQTFDKSMRDIHAAFKARNYNDLRSAAYNLKAVTG